jgi:Ser-tRNA(Ala) deacylase AlaX
VIYAFVYIRDDDKRYMSDIIKITQALGGNVSLIFMYVVDILFCAMISLRKTLKFSTWTVSSNSNQSLSLTSEFGERISQSSLIHEIFNHEKDQIDDKLYLTDTELFEIHGVTVLDVESGDFKVGNRKVLLDQTLFHPQGGGQPSDIGFLCHSGTACPIFAVKHVIINRNSQEIEHYGEFVDDDSLNNLEAGTRVSIRIDKKTRMLNAKLHSAGHILDAAMDRLSLSDALRPLKGYHFPDGPNVEYEIANEGLLDSRCNGSYETLIVDLNRVLMELISEDISTVVNDFDRDDAGKICKMDTTSYPQRVRVVYVASLPCPCGGTHVKKTSDINGIVVTGIKKKKKVFKVSYKLID